MSPRTIVAALAAAGAIALTGCAAATPAASTTPSPDINRSVFLEQWHETWPHADDNAAVELAGTVCDAYRAGTTFIDEVHYLMVTAKVSAGDAGAIIGMSTAAYCPEFNARH